MLNVGANIVRPPIVGNGRDRSIYGEWRVR